MSAATPAEHREGDTVAFWLDRLRGWAPLAATLFGALYAAGFVIVNAYLASYGVKELEAMRARYVGAGLIFVAFVALVIVGSGFVWERFAGKRPGRRLLLQAAVILVGPATLSAFESVLIWRTSAGPFGDQPLPEAFGQRFVLAVYISNLAILLFATGARMLGALPRSGYAAPVRGLFGWLTAFALAGVVVAYASYIYPAIPAYLGGGAPSRVRLVVSQQIADACPACVREDVLLIDEDSHRWVVLVRDQSGREMAVEIFLFANGDRALIHRR